MLSVNDVPASLDIFRRFPVESATIRYAVVGRNRSKVTMIIVTGQIGRPFSTDEEALAACCALHLIALSPRSEEIANGCVCLEA